MTDFVRVGEMLSSRQSTNIKISGKKLAALREREGLSQRAAGELMGISEKRVQQIEASNNAGVYAETLRKLAASLHRPFAEVRASLAEPMQRVRAAADSLTRPVENLRRQLHGTAVESNIDPYSETKLPGEIPTFELSVAAGQWVDVDDIGEVCDPRAMDHGLFRVRIRGDSMKPKFQDGDVVEFKCLRDGRDQLEIGAFYYVQRDDQATFKQLVEIDEAVLMFKALNSKKYPDKMHADRRSIVRMARAVGIFQNV